jgi:endonuclease YncB( thermonuclease family)
VGHYQGKIVSCDAHSQDGYGRTIATCYVDGTDLGAEMVRAGFAWAFVKCSTVYVEQEAEARALGLGIWQGASQPAWEYRAERWEAVEQQAPEGCPIKGNISQNGRIYHPPW